MFRKLFLRNIRYQTHISNKRILRDFKSKLVFKFSGEQILGKFVKGLQKLGVEGIVSFEVPNSTYSHCCSIATVIEDSEFRSYKFAKVQCYFYELIRIDN